MKKISLKTFRNSFNLSRSKEESDYGKDDCLSGSFCGKESLGSEVSAADGKREKRCHSRGLMGTLRRRLSAKEKHKAKGGAPSVASADEPPSPAAPVLVRVVKAHRSFRTAFLGSGQQASPAPGPLQLPSSEETCSQAENKELNTEHGSNILRKEDQVEKVKELNPQPSNEPEKKSPCHLQGAAAADRETNNSARSDTSNFTNQGSRNKPTTKHIPSQEESWEQQHQQQLLLLEAQKHCANFKREAENTILHLQQKLEQIKEKDKIIADLNQQLSSGNHKISKLQQEIHSKDLEIRKLKEKLASERSQWEKEKNKLEAKAKRCLTKLNGETSRAVIAEVGFLQNRRDFGLHQLEQTENECLLQLRRATSMALSHPESLQLKAAVDSWDIIVRDVRNKIAFCKTKYSEQITLVKNGCPLNCLLPVQIPPPPPSPDILMQHFLGKHVVKENSLRAFSNSPQLDTSHTGVVSTASQSRSPLATMVQPTQGPVLEAGVSEAVLGNERIKLSWERIMEKLKTAFPEYNKKELTDLLRKLKDANGRSLTGLTFDEIVRRVSQMIEPARSQNQIQGGQSTDSIPPSHPQPQPQPIIDQPPRSAWRSLTPQVPVAWEGTKNLGDEEELCVICHDNLTPENLFVLACAHKFHSQCIKPWLKQQGTCPTCRLYVVLPEEFPSLPSRHIPKM